MSHNHHTHNHTKEGSLGLAFALNLGFAIIEIIGGLLTNSIAILSDALHDAGDSLSLGLAWFLNRYAQKERTDQFSYGYRRFSLMGALINALILVAGSVFVLSEAIPRLFEPQTVHPPGMIGLAVLGITVNGLAAWRLRSGRTTNTRVVALHLLEDVLGWVAVLVVSIILLFAEVPILDPLLSIGITLYILFNVWQRLTETASLFLQGTPAEVSLPNIEDRLAHIEHVESIHHTHIWSLDGEHNVLTAHLVIPDGLPNDQQRQVRAAARDIVKDLNLEHLTLQVEFATEQCAMQHAEA